MLSKIVDIHSSLGPSKFTLLMNNFIDTVYFLIHDKDKFKEGNLLKILMFFMVNQQQFGRIFAKTYTQKSIHLPRRGLIILSTTSLCHWLSFTTNFIWTCMALCQMGLLDSLLESSKKYQNSLLFWTCLGYVPNFSIQKGKSCDVNFETKIIALSNP